MEKGIRSNDIINVEIVKNQLFGISINSIKEIADSRKTCVMTLNPEVRDFLLISFNFINIKAVFEMLDEIWRQP